MGVRRALPVLGLFTILLGTLVVSYSTQYATALSDGTVDSEQKISDTAGDFGGKLDDKDFFGKSVANIGDLDGNGVDDLAVGAHFDDDGGNQRGAVWILFLDTDGTLLESLPNGGFQKISDTEGDFGGKLDNTDFFGNSVANIGDLDGNGVDDLAVGASRDDDGGAGDTRRGAVWILFLDTDGTLLESLPNGGFQKISDTEGDFDGKLDNGDLFGQSVANIGDLDGNGVDDLAVGAIGDDDGGSSRGAVWILFMDSNGKVLGEQKISELEGDFDGTLADVDLFGFSIANIGDLDGNGVDDLAVGAFFDDDGGTNRGAVWILFLDTDGTLLESLPNGGFQKISDTAGDFEGTLVDENRIGTSVANIGDLDGNGVDDLAVGASGDDDGGEFRGAVWILFMDSNGKVLGEQKISDTAGGFGGTLDDGDTLGGSVANIGDLDGNGVDDLAVAAPGDDDGGTGQCLTKDTPVCNRGAVWILFLKSSPSNDSSGGGDNQWDTRPSFGISHETRQDQIVENGFRFNTEQFTLTDNHWTDFAEQSVEIGTINSFSATVWADKKLKVQEFLFGIPNVGEAHLAELGVEIWYDIDGEIEDVIVVQNSHVIDPDTVSVSHEMTKCLPTDAETRCDTTTVSMKFLEPLKDKVMAIKAIDWKNRDQRTFLNEGFDISGESLNPMLTKMIPSAVRYEGLLKVTQVAKYSPYWVAEDDRTFEMNSFGSFKQINYKFERFQDTGDARTRAHSGYGGIIAYEQDRALDVFDSSKYISELPESFAYIFPETGERITDEMRQAMLVQEQIAKEVLDEMDKQDRNY